MATLRDRLREARERLGLTQTALAKQIGVTSQTVTQWESEAADKKPSRENLFRVAKITGASVDWLLYGGPARLTPDGQFASPVYRVGAIPMLSVHDALLRRQPATDAHRISSFFPHGENAYYFVVPNTSNAPDHPRGSVWIMDPDKKPEADNFVLAACNEPPEPILGRIRYETTREGVVTIVEPTNSKWPQARSDLGYLDIIAVMTESIRPGA